MSNRLGGVVMSATECAKRQGDDIVDVVYVLQNLGPALTAIRIARRLSLREVARQCGESFSTVARIEKGQNCQVSSAVSILLWIRGLGGSDE